MRGRRARTTRRRRAALGRELGGVASAECDDELGTGDRGGPAESDLRRSGGSSAPAAGPKRRKFGSGGATAEGLDPTEEVRLRRRACGLCGSGGDGVVRLGKEILTSGVHMPVRESEIPVGIVAFRVYQTCTGFNLDRDCKVQGPNDRDFDFKG